MKRTLITAAVAATLGLVGIAAYAHGDHAKGCEAGEGKTCPQGEHRHGGKEGAMQNRMQGKHGDMEKQHGKMAEMHARMHGGKPGGDKPAGDDKGAEHKH